MKGGICTVFDNQVLRIVCVWNWEEGGYRSGGRDGRSGEIRTSRAHRTPKAEQKCVRNLGP